MNTTLSRLVQIIAGCNNASKWGFIKKIRRYRKLWRWTRTMDAWSLHLNWAGRRRTYGNGTGRDLFINGPWRLESLDEKLRSPLPPFQWWKKWCVWGLSPVQHWGGGEGEGEGGLGGFISYFILTKIVVLATLRNLSGTHLRNDRER